MVTKQDNPNVEQQTIIDKVAEWIDTNQDFPGIVLAEAIAEDLVDMEMEVSMDNMEQVWYNILENELQENIRYAIEAIKTGWRSP